MLGQGKPPKTPDPDKFLWINGRDHPEAGDDFETEDSENNSPTAQGSQNEPPKPRSPRNPFQAHEPTALTGTLTIEIPKSEEKTEAAAARVSETLPQPKSQPFSSSSTILQRTNTPPTAAPAERAEPNPFMTRALTQRHGTGASPKSPEAKRLEIKSLPPQKDCVDSVLECLRDCYASLFNSSPTKQKSDTEFVVEAPTLR